MKIYYAHFMGIYDTLQEKRDIELLQTLGFDVLNPNTPEVQAGIEAWKEANPEKDGDALLTQYFGGLIKGCQAFAFRGITPNQIPSGVYKELLVAQEIGLPIIELPGGLTQRALSVDSTREYLREYGKR